MMSDALQRRGRTLRWEVTRFFIHLGIGIAPDGPARNLLLSHLRAFSDEIIRACQHEQTPAAPLEPTPQPLKDPTGHVEPSDTINAPHGADNGADNG